MYEIEVYRAGEFLGYVAFDERGYWVTSDIYRAAVFKTLGLAGAAVRRLSSAMIDKTLTFEVVPCDS